MTQSRRMSFLEAITNVAVGYGIAVLVQILLFAIFGLEVDLALNLVMGSVFTGVSIARSYLLRRTFERMRARRVAR